MLGGSSSTSVLITAAHGGGSSCMGQCCTSVAGRSLAACAGDMLVLLGSASAASSGLSRKSASNDMMACSAWNPRSALHDFWEESCGDRAKCCDLGTRTAAWPWLEALWQPL